MPDKPLQEQTSDLVSLANDSKGRMALSEFLYQAFNSLKLYGKQAEQLEDAIVMHQMVLADYPYEKVKKACLYYLKHNNEMPAPSDIVTIIERGNKPPFDRAVYVSINKKEPELRTSEEWAYLRDYERFIVEGQYQ